MIGEVFFLLTLLSIIALYLLAARSWLDVSAITAYYLTFNMLGAAVYVLLPGYPERGLTDSVYLGADLPLLAAVMWLFYGAALLTLFLLSPWRPAFRRTLPRLAPDGQAVRTLFWLGTLLVAVSLAVNLGLLARLGGVGQAINAYHGGNVPALNLVRPILIASAYVPATALAAMIKLQADGTAAFGRAQVAMAALVTVLGMASIGLTGDRDTMFAPVLILLTTYLVMVRGWGMVRFGVIAVLVLAMVGPAAMVREGLKKGTFEWDMIGDGLESVVVRVSTNTIPLNTSLSVMEATGDWRAGEYGLADYALSTIAVIPRYVWTAKPDYGGSGQRFKGMINETDASSGWPAYPPVLALYNGGLMAVVVAGFLTGLGTLVVQSVYGDAKRNPLALTVSVLIVLKVLGMGFRDSSIFNFLIYLLPLMGLVLLANTVASGGAGRARRASDSSGA
jgi:hypothetical protein